MEETRLERALTRPPREASAAEPWTRALASTYVAELRLRQHARSGRAAVCLARPLPADLHARRADFLHPNELELLASLEPEELRRRYLLGRYCAKQALCAQLGRDEPGRIYVERGVFDQPVVHHPWGTNLQVTLSHWGDAGAALAFPEAWPLGLDVERADAPGARETPIILPAERRLLETVRIPGLAHPAGLLWTARQALSKVLRAGLDASLGIYEVEEVEVAPDAVCCAFKHFRQYRATSFLVERFFLTLVHPRDTVLELDLPALRGAVRQMWGAGVATPVEVAPAAARGPSRSTPVIFMFSGQGSQYHHMGRELLKGEPVFREWMHGANEHLRSRFGLDVLGAIYDPARARSDPFDNTLYSSPAIFIVQHALARLLLEKGLQPDYLLGSSLGEFIAATVAGALELEDALDIIVTHTLMVRRHCEEGGMTAVLASESLFREEPALHDGTELAAVNFDGSFVISGAREPLRAAERFLQEQDIGFEPLPVSYGYHSSQMEAMGPSFRDYLQWVPMRRPGIPLISCAEAGLIERVTPAHLWKVGREPILFQRTIQSLHRGGGFTFIDLSPSGTLASCVKYNLPARSPSRSLMAMTPHGEDLQTLAGVEAALSTPD